MISSITKPLTEHLMALKNEFYFSYQDYQLVSKQLYHYFCHSYQYYKQYPNPHLESFQIVIRSKRDEVMLKVLEIGLIASTFYVMFQDTDEQTYEKNRCTELENLNLFGVVQKFYQDGQFAKDLILGFMQSDFYEANEMEEKRENIRQKGKESILFSLYPIEPIDQAIYEYQKKKAYKKDN